jgi:hypothetical protein
MRDDKTSKHGSDFVNYSSLISEARLTKSVQIFEKISATLELHHRTCKSRDGLAAGVYREELSGTYSFSKDLVIIKE